MSSNAWGPTEAAVPSAQEINQDHEFFAVSVCKQEFESVYQSHRYTQPFFCNLFSPNTAEQSFVHSLFESKNFAALYQHFPQTVNQMLMIESKEDFDDFLQNGEMFEESLFLLYHSAQQQNALLLGGYIGDATELVFSFLSKKLPCSLVLRLQNATDSVFLDLDSENTPEQAVSAFNDLLSDTGYGILLQFDDTFCAGNWFLSVFYTPLPAEKERLTNG